MGNIPTWIIKMVQGEAPKSFYILNKLLVEKCTLSPSCYDPFVRYGERKVPLPSSPYIKPAARGRDVNGEIVLVEAVDEEGDLFHDVAEYDGDSSKHLKVFVTTLLSMSR